jgi:hypothetical protein
VGAVLRQYLDKLDIAVERSGLIAKPELDLSAQPGLIGAGEFGPTFGKPAPKQLLNPTDPWDWPSTAPGLLGEAPFRFADILPWSSEPNTVYEPSSFSFSNGYRAFLSSIDTTRFAQANLLASAKALMTQPTADPATGRTPQGWTKVTVNDIVRWKPGFSFSDNAQNWKLKVETGSINNPQTITLQLNGSQDAVRLADANVLTAAPIGGGAAKPLNSAAFEQVSVYASCWGLITITPGDWFDPSIVKLGGRYVDADTFFGDGGLLNRRVSAFYVAYKPKFTFSSEAPIDPAVRATVAGAGQIYALGVKVTANSSSRNDMLDLISDYSGPSIIAVLLETYSL